MKIYISGAITNDKNAKKNFKEAEKRLKVKFPGAEIVNPFNVKVKKNATYQDYMRADIKELVSCDAIYVLETSYTIRSNGANVERGVANAIGLLFIYEKEARLIG